MVEQGKVDERRGIKTLSDVEGGVVIEVLSCKIGDTRNGDAVIATVIMPQHQKTRGETTLVLPMRFAEEMQRKAPCLLFYGGIKNLQGGKKCHDVTLVKANDGVVFHESDEEADDESSDGEEEANVMSIKDFMPTCPTCGATDEHCIGRCSVCNEHQPLNGSQCRCLI